MTFIVDFKSGSGMIRSGRRGRVLIGAAQREALLDEFDRSGQSVMAFCRLHGLVYPTFATWVQKRRRRQADTLPTAPAFAEVIVDHRAEVSTAAPDAELRITLRSGVSFEVSSSGQIPLVTELIQSLSSLRPC